MLVLDSSVIQVIVALELVMEDPLISEITGGVVSPADWVVNV